MKKKRIYISGAMSDVDPKVFEKNVQHFHHAEGLLKLKGYSTANPANAWPCRFGWLYRVMERLLGKERAYRTVLCYDLWLLSRCDGICMIDGWHGSRGARIEEGFAFRLGIVRYYEYQREEESLTPALPDDKPKKRKKRTAKQGEKKAK